MSIAMTKRPVLVAMLLLMASMLAALIAPMRVPGGGITEATTTLFECQGTWFFDSSSAGVTFHEGDIWQDGEFTDIENDHMMLVRLDNGHEVGRFPQGFLLGDESTIQFGSPIRITAILWHDNDPNPGEDGWSFNGIVGPITGDGNTIVTPVDITTSSVNLKAGGDSGGIDFCFELVDGQGCTPGYWKNHLDAWVGYSPNQTLESVFDVPDAYGLDNVTLLDAMGLGGGPTAQAAAGLLLHHAVAALLNATNPNVSYGMSPAGVISATNAALATGDRSTMLTQKTTFDTANNAGCPLN
jgi:hypothetical protein